MTAKPQKAFVPFGRFFNAALWQLSRVKKQGGAVSVFQSTIAVVGRMQHKHIAFKWRLPGFWLEQGNLRFAHRFHVIANALQVQVCIGTIHGEYMFNAEGRETFNLQFTHFHRVINQAVKVVRLKPD